MENQVLGLAEAVARLTPAVIETKRVAIRAPYNKLPRGLFGPSLSRLAPESSAFSPPWPDIWIACGRLTVPLSMEVRPHVPFIVQTQDPRAPMVDFDLVVPPAHDQVTGTNVLSIIGAPNRLTEARLQQDAEALQAVLPEADKPYAVALIGGDSKDYQLTGPVLSLILEALAAAEDAGHQLLITPSRRTSDLVKAHLHEALPDAWIWDGAPVGELENPYFGMLGLAERFYVTCESTNMLTDAAFTGKPVHMLPLEGGAAKWRRFHASLEEHGVLRPDLGPDDQWSYDPIRETARAAREILSRIGRD